MQGVMNRRELVQLFAGAALALQLPAADPQAPLFFTKDEFALLDELTELIIPTDDHSPGAKEAGVAAYIDRTAAEAVDPEDRNSWRAGLQVVDKLSTRMHGHKLLEATHDQQVATLQKMAANEKKPTTPEEKFFTQLKQSTAFAYYSASTGIHQDIGYKGNVILQEFVGIAVT
jgi:gluconate 2-dehydrogenase gamma chain